ncbi:hypothetical protein PIB30_050053 [Stylosanthes scabra]|uniref:Uncharacterized protein n=1 Tax=Stylosanthes scabra TaxID=79078 RepID=A0ABU6SHG2_9FABA|nr:hypothetical protein [Stylosanthes scabra]
MDDAGAMLKDSGVGSAWMHASQGNFPRICVGLLCLCVGVKLVGESGSCLNMSKHELERELVGLGGFPRICVDFPRLCVVRRGKGATPRLDQGCLGVDGSLLSTHMHPLPRICVLFHAYAWNSSSDLLTNFVSCSASFLSSFFLKNIIEIRKINL